MKKYTSYILFVTVFLFLIPFTSYSQVSIQGIINKYAAVDSIYPTKDTIEVVDASEFSENDTVMIYQAQGSTVYKDTSILPEQFGNVRTGLKQAGKYEIILIKKIEGNRIIFKATLANAYDEDGMVQLIRVPYYERASIDAELTCKAWDGSSGGVLALMVSDTLFMNADINVTGKGFRGATPLQYPDLGGNACSVSDTSLYKSYYFNILADTVMAGMKGEGVGVHDSAYIKGLGRWANGGGGGNGRFTGGGGGGAYGPGGFGGAEDTTYCSILGNVWKNIGGLGGEGLRSTETQYDDSTIFLGGGGGSGAYISGLNATKGGNGGGIVILIVKNLKSNGHQIIANGESVSAIATASAGGGGGAGAVVFDVDTLFGNLSIYSNGGQGGFVQSLGEGGTGGGGGGGAIFWNKTKPDNIVIAETKGGDAGIVEDLSGGQDEVYFAGLGENGNAAGIGEPYITVQVPLTGFLFNTITADQQVCYGSTPEILAGSNPRGGSGEFVFQWQESPDGVDWDNIVGEKERDFQPPALTDTIYYRRIVKSGAAVGDSITDISLPIEIIVHNKIQVNHIFGDDLIICINNIADTITGTTATFGGVGAYQYTWQYTYDFIAWNTIADLNDTICLPGIVTDTTHVRRKVVSGGCIDYSDTLTIIGLPLITNNIISGNQEICYGSLPEEILGEVPQDGLGSGSYINHWQEKSETSGWSTISGETGNNLILPNLYETMYYRRVVDSDDCSDTSNVIKINVLPLIGNNSIENDNPIFTCYNTAPELLTGTNPTGGDNSYTYQWQDSIIGGTWNNITDNAVNIDYQALALTDTTFYRRIVKSGINDCCIDTSVFIKVKIYDLPKATIDNIIDTVCSGTEIDLVFNFEKGKQPYILTYSNGDEEFTPSAIDNATATIQVSPETETTSKEFNYTVINVTDDNGCVATDMSGLTKVTVYGNPVSNAGTDAEVCLLNYQFNAIPSLGSGMWTQASGRGVTTFENNTLPNTSLDVNIAGVYAYAWTETNWECVNSDIIEVTLYQKPQNINAGSDTTLFFVNELELKGKYINPDTVVEASSLWERILGSAGDFDDPSDKETRAYQLSDASNTGIILLWTISKGICEDQYDSLKINLKEIFTPTGFSPNGDGENDFLKFNGLEHSANNELTIFNRWGVVVYSKVNYSNDMGWDGKNDSGNDLPEDTYYYILKVTDFEGASEVHKGFIVLKRD
ncbi:MAG TPA: gliding motility-associated C-terminal domain-containing protein [Bacteroidales bacterium]|nr:gliding motility-associated C-terminal domain-containing protein [Bacteroidales bacterium]